MSGLKIKRKEKVRTEMGLMCVMRSWTLGPITGGVPTPPPVLVSRTNGRGQFGASTIFEPNFSQNGLAVVFKHVARINDGEEKLRLTGKVNKTYRRPPCTVTGGKLRTELCAPVLSKVALMTRWVWLPLDSLNM